MFWIRDYNDRRWHLQVEGVLSCDGRKPMAMQWVQGPPVGLPSKCRPCLADMLEVSRELSIYQLGPLLREWMRRQGLRMRRFKPEYTVWYHEHRKRRGAKMARSVARLRRRG